MFCRRSVSATWATVTRRSFPDTAAPARHWARVIATRAHDINTPRTYGRRGGGGGEARTIATHLGPMADEGGCTLCALCTVRIYHAISQLYRDTVLHEKTYGWHSWPFHIAIYRFTVYRYISTPTLSTALRVFYRVMFGSESRPPHGPSSKPTTACVFSKILPNHSVKQD